MVDHGTKPRPSGAPGQSSSPDAGERVAKALARAGVASRRDVERLIEAGRVALNGRPLSSPAVRVTANDILTVDGAVISEAEPTRLWRYHKPVGLVTTHSDPKGRPTVFENLPEGLPRVISVGRLDLNSEGLLLLTNDGGLARALELPSAHLMRRYRARAYGATDQATLDRLKEGVVVEGVAYGPIEARLDKARGGDEEGRGPRNLWITVALAEGKNREVRRVLESIGLKVNRLIRLAYGPFALGALERGCAEEVGPRVIRELLSEHIAPENLPKGDRTGPVLKAKGDAGRPRRPLGRGAPRAEAAPERPAKIERKAGWAKPKKRAPAHAAPKKLRGASAPRRGPSEAPPAAPQAAASMRSSAAASKAGPKARARPTRGRPAKPPAAGAPGGETPRRPRRP